MTDHEDPLDSRAVATAITGDYYFYFPTTDPRLPYGVMREAPRQSALPMPEVDFLNSTLIAMVATMPLAVAITALLNGHTDVAVAYARGGDGYEAEDEKGD